MYKKIEPAINSGGYGTTYYAKSDQNDKIYVIKEVNLKRVNLAQIYFEIDALYEIQMNECRNDILCIEEYYVDYEKQTINIVMKPFIKDNKLPLNMKEFLRMNKLGELEILTLMERIIEAIVYIHELGMGHGDIKPENILINQDFEIQIIDFGFACVRECMVGGTPIYESPEMLKMMQVGNNAIPVNFQQKSDIFSLGLVFYEMANGKLPYKRITNVNKLTIQELINELIELYKNEKIRSENENENINRIINQMIEINPNKRVSAVEIEEEIREMYIYTNIYKDIVKK
jgi:non-specific serine/threonine protein kinase